MQQAPATAKAKLPFAGLGATIDASKLAIGAKVLQPTVSAKKSDLVIPTLSAQTIAGDTTVSALFTQKYATAKETRRNEKRQDKIQKKLAQATAQK